MSSRGRGLLHSFLKEKEKKEEPIKAEEEKPDESEEKAAIPSAAAAATSAQLPASTRTALGRGRRLFSSSEEPKAGTETITSGLERVSLSQETKVTQIKSEQFEDVETFKSEIKIEKRETSVERQQVSESLGAKPISRGRGKLANLKQVVKTLGGEEERGEPSPPPQPAPQMPVPSLSQVITSTFTEKLEIREEVVRIKDIERVSVTTERRSNPESTTTPTRSVMQSVATTASESIGRALEELKVEHIMRKEPVKRMGEAGMPNQFLTNYIRLKCKNKGIYQYVVHFDPPIESQRFRIKIVHRLKEILGPVQLFDGFTLFLPILLKDKITKVSTKYKELETQISIQLTKILPPEQIPPVVFNIIFKNIMRELKMTRIGQHYFSQAKQIDVPNHALQIWPGYVTAVHEFEDGLYLVLDVAHKVLRSQTCWHLMNDLHQAHSANLSTFRQEVFNNIVGNIILTKYNNRTYRVDDILWDSNPMTEFNFANGGKISYYEYYKKHYGIEIQDLRQPLLANRMKQKQGGSPTSGGEKQELICLVPELCFLTGLTNEIRNDTTIKRDLATTTRLTPAQRNVQLENYLDSVRHHPEALKYLTDWGLDLDDQLSVIDGRVLPSEKIIFGRREVEIDFKCDWTKAAGNEEVLRAVDLKEWLCVYPAKNEKNVERFVMMAFDSATKIGIRLNQPIIVPLRDERPDTYYNEIKRNLNENVQMVVIVFPMLSDSRYMRVKKLCCIEYPVPSQVVVLKTISKQDNVLRTVAQKIVLQMNVKLGGELWRLPIPIKKLMIVGIDVYHKIEKKYKSIAGFVSSLNGDQTRWYSKVCFQMTGQELTDTLKTAFSQALRKYYEVNNFLPDKIIIFRDGVSEGQLNYVAEHEVVQLRETFAKDYCPQMSVIVVQKRINTRLFAAANQGLINPKPGSVVDHRITSRDLFDFFLVSQHVTQGTVTPTHYIVVYDDTQLKPDYIQRISYKMTHMYYNWSGTIRVPAPCQYAHKLAFLTGQYLQDEPSEALCNRLFYL